MGCNDCGMSLEQVQEGFLKSPKYIGPQLEVMRKCHGGSFWRGLYDFEVMPDGVGDTITTDFFHGEMPSFDGYEGFRPDMPESAGIGCESDPCGLQFEEVGWGLESVNTRLWRGEWRTKKFCVERIRTKRKFMQVMEQIPSMLNMYTMGLEEGVVKNTIIDMAQKYVPTGVGLQHAPDPRQFPVFDANTEVARLDVDLMLYLHQLMASSGVCGMGNSNKYLLIGSQHTLRNALLDSDKYCEALVRDPGKRDSFFNQYNITQSYADIFAFAYDNKAPRYNRDAAGNLYRVMPHIKGVEAQCGTMDAPNPEYPNAEYELLLIVPDKPISMLRKAPRTTLGGGSDFGADAGIGEWKWFRDVCEKDPIGKYGFWYMTMRFGIRPLAGSRNIYGVLVRRKGYNNSRSFHPAPVCPPTASACTGGLPAQACPCLPKADCCNGVGPFNKIVTLVSAEASWTPGATVEVQLTTGGTAEAIVEAAPAPFTDADGSTTYSLTFTEEYDCGCIAGPICEDLTVCSSELKDCNECRIVDGEIGLEFKQQLALPNGAGDIVDLTMGDGSVLSLPVASVEGCTYFFALDYSDYCEAGKAKSACVPTATNPDCPDCASAASAPCDGTAGTID